MKEQSLESVDDILLRLRFKSQKLEHEVKSIIHGQSNAVDGTKELEKAKKAIQELYTKIKLIKDKSNTSEGM